MRYDLISSRMNFVYETARNTTTADIIATMCGHTSRKLCTADIGLLSRPDVWSCSNTPRLRTVGFSNVSDASENRNDGEIRDIHVSRLKCSIANSWLSTSPTKKSATAPATRIRKNVESSHSPIATIAETTVLLKNIEHDIETASHRPRYAIETMANPIKRTISSPSGTIPREAIVAPTIASIVDT